MSSIVAEQVLHQKIAIVANTLSRKLGVSFPPDLVKTVITAVQTNELTAAIAEISDYLANQGLPPIFALPLVAAASTKESEKVITRYAEKATKLIGSGKYEKVLDLTKQMLGVGVE